MKPQKWHSYPRRATSTHNRIPKCVIAERHDEESETRQRKQGEARDCGEPQASITLLRPVALITGLRNRRPTTPEKTGTED